MKNLLVLLSAVLCQLNSIAQDAHFSQYNASRLNTNPAFSGTDSALIVSTGYRYQWPNIGGYKTFYISCDEYVSFLRGGFGLNFMHENQADGVLKKTTVDIMYSPEIALFKKRLILRPALQVGYARRVIDWSKLTFGDMIDARRGFIYNSNEVPGLKSRSIIDFSGGLLLYSNRFHAGVAVHHLTQPDEGFIGPSPLPMRFTVHGGVNLNFKSVKRFTFSPTVLYQKQADFNMLIAGVNSRYKNLLFGMTYRFQDAPIAMIGFQNRFLRVSYTFDYTLSTLTLKETGGSHEIQLSCYLYYEKRNTVKELKLL